MAAPPAQPPYYPNLPATFVVDSEGFLIDPFSLEVEVLTDEGDEAMVRDAVDLTAYPTGDRLGLGYFRAGPYDPQDEDWGVGPDPGPGRRIVRWYAVLSSGDAEITWTTYTERLAGGAKPDQGVPYYALIADLRAEGFALAVLTDARAAMLLGLATRYVEMFTGRRFVPEPKRLAVSGGGGGRLMLKEPICGLDPDGLRVDLEPYPVVSSSTLPYSRDTVRVYSRHLTQRLTQPDDRQNPKIEVFDPVGVRHSSGTGGLASRYAFPRGQQNVHVTGVFGFTEPDGSPAGATPALIRHATMLLVRRHMLGGGIGAGGGPSGGGAVTAERTRDQSVSYAAPGSVGSGRAGGPLLGAFTGDPEIDTILAAFMRSPSIAAV
jgi:hypothetical protein